MSSKKYDDGDNGLIILLNVDGFMMMFMSQMYDHHEAGAPWCCASLGYRQLMHSSSENGI